MAYFKVKDGVLLGAVQAPSPNFNTRPDEDDIALLVIHNISLPPGEFGGESVTHFFQNTLDHHLHPFFEQIKDLQVSAHLFINRQGMVSQFVNFNDRAWHAGVSRVGNRENCNDFSIGIEMEGTDELPYEKAQYRVLAQVSKAIAHAYPKISTRNTVGHCDIAPGRKTDPGECFDWEQYFKLWSQFQNSES